MYTNQSLDNKLQQVPPLSPPSDTSSSHILPLQQTTIKSSPQLKHSPPPSPVLTSINQTLSKPDSRKTTQILSSLQKHSSSWPFLRPVDPSIDPAPNYFEIIKNPIDLSTIATSLKNGKYTVVDDFVKDMRLMFSNCFVYNPVGHVVHDEGVVLEKHLNSLLGNFYPELEDDVACKKRKARSKVPILLEEDTTQKQEDEFIQNSSSSDCESITLPKKRTIQKNTYYYKKKLLLQSQNPAPPKKKLKHQHRHCAYCGTNETPMWRRGPLGTGTLCNKCGVKWRHGKILPSSPPPQPQRKPIKKLVSAVKPTTLSAVQKQCLSMKINSLPLSKLRHVISIIQDERAFLNGGVQEEGDMELDLNALSNGCCEKLWEFVMDGDDELE